MDKKIKNVLICGLGAIGSIYATIIKDNNITNLKILVDENRLNKYKTTPLIFNGKPYVFDYTTPDNNDYKADLIIIATKNNTLKEVLKNIKNFVIEDTLIISLLNGLKSEELIAKEFGKEKIIDSYYIGHTSTRTNRQIIHDGIYKTVFGEKNNTTLTSRVLKVKDFLEKNHIPFEIPIDMEYSKWWKFLVNIGYNQASVIFNAPYKDFQQNEAVNNFAIQLMKEAASIAKAENVKNTEKFIPEILDVIKGMRPETKTSMLQDVEAKRETEIDSFAGYIIELANKHNIDTPYNKIVYDIIKAIDTKTK